MGILIPCNEDYELSIDSYLKKPGSLPTSKVIKPTASNLWQAHVVILFASYDGNPSDFSNKPNWHGKPVLLTVVLNRST